MAKYIDNAKKIRRYFDNATVAAIYFWYAIWVQLTGLCI